MKIKKILAVTLCFFTVFSFTGLGAFAAENNSYTNNHETCDFMVFGDSFSRGMGCSDTWVKETGVEYQYGPNQSRCITGAYPTLVAQALDCELSPNNFLEEKNSTYWPIVHNGLSLSATLDLLGIDDDFYDDAFYHATWSAHYKRYFKFLEYFGCPESFSNDCDEPWGDEGTTYNIRSMVENMDVITLQLGQSDVLNIPLFQALHEYTGGEFDFSGLTTEEIAQFVGGIIEQAYKRYDQFIASYPLLLQYLREANPNADILVLSIVNPAFGADLSEDIRIPVGQAFSLISANMNQYLQQWCKTYGCTYVDISNVETATTENDWSIIDDLFGGGTDEYFNYEVGTHPSPEGHKQIARAILTALEEKTVTTDIVVDLGRFSQITYVLLDGKIIQDYTFDEKSHTLTIPNQSKCRSRLTVAVKENKKLSFTTYQLAYHKDKGYSAYRLYTRNDTATLTTSAANFVRNAMSSLTKLFQK